MDEHPGFTADPTTDSTAGGWDDVIRDLRHSRDGSSPDAGGRHVAPLRRRVPRRARLWLAVVVLIGVALVSVVVVVREPATGPVTRSVVEVDATWADLLTRLDAARVEVWATGSGAAALGAIDVAGSPAARADLLVVKSLRRQKVRPAGLRFEIDAVGVVTAEAERVVLRVVDRRSSYSLVDGSGRVVRRVAARAERAWQIELRRQSGLWLAAVVTPLGA